ncbi:restriction endonuclease [Arthrobacter sp. APC 3897]|uniref:nSTAND3 domain-containing NTPase n=1 Tax=Arthrobacter sp. APC 3897 TaxID=3035204 RepID=UPI0025B4B45A|nr:restriction endonuclease [Arthrobacter sp. APC 3897]MDN3480998.1 restriction endonuclease [Arthrobacter sp. APC 3897]
MPVRNGAAIAVASPNFALHTLGWRAFQDLCLVVMREELGQTVQSFADSNDGGRDGAFEGVWNPDGDPASALSGNVVVQCKATTRDDAAISLSHLTGEIDKARKLVKDGRCDSYILMTNATVSGDAAGKIETALKSAGVQHFMLFERSRISLAISSNSNLRRFVPRVYGLGDLSTILDERRHDQAKALLASLGQDLATFVPTDSHRRAVEAVQRHGFVLLLGDPASGKSVIASTLAAAAMHEWDCLVQRPTTPEALVSGWNPHEPGQFFWLDDVFGSVRFDPSKAENWISHAPAIRAAISGGAKVVLTSRGYIWNEAQSMVKTYTFPLLKDKQVIIDLADLSLIEKKRMLYNHIKLGNQDSSFKEELRPFLHEVAELSSFKPEIARRLGAKEFTRGLLISRTTIHRFFERNNEFTAEIFEALDVHYKAALSLVYMSVDGLPSPIPNLGIYREILNNLGTNVGQVSAALRAMTGSFVRYVESVDEPHWQFWHPTLREGFAGLISNDPQLLGVFVEGLSPSNIVEKLSCGGQRKKTGLGNVVNVPRSLYKNVVKRLCGYVADKDNLSSIGLQELRYSSFLYEGTSDEFLRLMIEADPSLVSRLLPRGERFDQSMVIRLCARLHSLGLLEEASRTWIVRESSERALDVPDDSWLSDHVLSLHTHEETLALVERLREELLPDINGVVNSWSDDWSSEDDPEEYFAPLIECFDNYGDYFQGLGDPSATREFRKASKSAESDRNDLIEFYEPAPEEDWERPYEEPGSTEDGRDMFDDVHR